MKETFVDISASVARSRTFKHVLVFMALILIAFAGNWLFFTFVSSGWLYYVWLVVYAIILVPVLRKTERLVGLRD